MHPQQLTVRYIRAASSVTYLNSVRVAYVVILRSFGFAKSACDLHGVDPRDPKQEMAGLLHWQYWPGKGRQILVKIKRDGRGLLWCT